MNCVLICCLLACVAERRRMSRRGLMEVVSRKAARTEATRTLSVSWTSVGKDAPVSSHQPARLHSLMIGMLPNESDNDEDI